MAKSLKLSLAKILDVEPSPISSMTLNHHNNKLALFRGGSTGQIELWDVSDQPYLEKVLIDLEKLEEQPSIESIIWARGRLFSCGLHGFVIEHDIHTGLIKSKTAATSGPVWCLAANANENIIAAGTEDGFVNLFQIDQDTLSYIKVLDRQEGRVLCLHWSPCGKYIATGSLDSIRLWDVEKGHAVQRLTTGRSKNKETIVWSVLILDGLTIVSGDSRGIVSFWDGRIGVLKFKIQTHKADVLTLRLSKDKNSIYAAGVDPIVFILTKVGNNSDKWVKSHPRNIHFNDVLTLETFANRLFSGGIDGDLAMSSFPPKIIAKYPPLLKSPFVLTNKEGPKIVLVKQIKGVALWKLPYADNSNLQKLVQLESKNNENVYSICLNSNGTKFGYSTLSGVNFFTIRTNPVQLQKVKFKNENMKLSHLHFLDDKSVLLVSGKSVSFVEIEDENAILKDSLELDSPFDGNILTSIGDIICLTSEKRILILDFKLQIKCTLPKHIAIPTCASFHPNNKKNYILITYSDHLVQVYDYSNKKIIFQEFVNIKKKEVSFPFSGADWCPNGNYAVLFTVESLFLLEMTKEEEEPSKKLRKGSHDSHSEHKFILKCCNNKYKYLTFMAFQNDQEIVAVESCSFVEKLPPAFAKKRFGF